MIIFFNHLNRLCFIEHLLVGESCGKHSYLLAPKLMCDLFSSLCLLLTSNQIRENQFNENLLRTADYVFGFWVSVKLLSQNKWALAERLRWCCKKASKLFLLSSLSNFCFIRQSIEKLCHVRNYCEGWQIFAKDIWEISCVASQLFE